MTKEQEKAIERLSLNSITSSNEELKDYPNMICLKKDVIEVLNMLKEKDKEIEKYKNMIIEHKKQLKQSGIYGYDYDLKID